MSGIITRFKNARAAAGRCNKKGAAPQRDPNGMNTMKSTSPTPLGQPQLSFIREGHVTFSPAQAALVLKWCRYERQRDETKAKSHILRLAEYMRRGQWLEKSQLDFARVNGSLTMVNGHHRMRAQVESGVDILWNIAIHDCASDDEVKGLYYRFDTDLRKRSASAILNGIALGEDLGLTKSGATALWKAAPTIGEGLRFKRYAQSERGMLTDEQVAICHEYAKEAAFMDTAIKAAPAFMRRKLFSTSVFSVAMVTLKYRPEIAREFWMGLCEDNGLTKGDPRKTLLTDMQTRSGSKGLLAAGMMATAKAWNAYHQGRDLKIIKITGYNVQVSGTPFAVQA